MKKIIGIVIASLVFCNIGFAEIKRIENTMLQRNLFMATVCVDGYKFVVSYNSSKIISTVQFFEERDGKSLPAKC